VAVGIPAVRVGAGYHPYPDDVFVAQYGIDIHGNGLALRVLDVVWNLEKTFFFLLPVGTSDAFTDDDSGDESHSSPGDKAQADPYDPHIYHLFSSCRWSWTGIC
jgi:hypothetical protein